MIEITRNKRNEFAFDILAWVLKARSRDEQRENINGILVEVDPLGQRMFVATDGHRLHTAVLVITDREGKEVEAGFYRFLKGSRPKHLLFERDDEPRQRVGAPPDEHAQQHAKQCGRPRGMTPPGE